MIYEYEAAVLQYVNRIIPSIQLMTYAKQQDMFNAMSQVTRFPAFFYYRQPVNWDFNKVYKVADLQYQKQFVPFEQTYVGRILLENQQEVFSKADDLRFGWHDNPYLWLNWPNAEAELSVALRLLYIKVDEDRAPDDKKGAQRYIEFSWKSQLFQERGKEIAIAEQINIHLSDGYIPTYAEIYNGDFLIKTISLVNP